MSNIIQSPNMNLPVPVVGQELGPQYASDVNNCMGLIDSHNHSFGQGVQVSPDGLNINSDLSIQGNNLTNIRAVRFNSQLTTIPSVSPEINECYVTAGDLYFNDGFNNIVRITQSGGVAGSPGSISGLVSPASASYNPGTSTFTWQSAANTSAAMDNGPITIRNIVAASPGITIQAPNSLVTPYTLTLPVVLPVSKQYMTLDNSGNISTTPVPSVNYVISPGCGVFFTTSNLLVPVTNLSVTITTSGGPVIVGLTPDPTTPTSPAEMGGTSTSLGWSSEWSIFRDGSQTFSYRQTQSSPSGSSTGSSPPSIIFGFDAVSPGTYTYTFNAAAEATTAFIHYTSLYAYELK
jgi:hypothetical protein